MIYSSTPNGRHLRIQVTYSGTKSEVATSWGLGGDAFTRKYSILDVKNVDEIPI